MAYPFLEDLVRDLFGIDIPLPVPMFGLMVALCVFTGIWLTRKEVERMERENLLPVKKGKPKISSDIVEFGTVAVLAGVVGARLFHILEYPREFMEDPWGMIFSRGGLTIFGGIIFGVFAGIWFLKRKRIPIWPVGDASAPSLMLGYGIGRIGCQIAGDGDWGIASNMSLKPEWLPKWFWAQTYEGNVVGVVIPEPGVYPTPMYESLMAFALFGVLWTFRRHRFQPGWLFFFYLLLSGIERILIEQIRVNATYDLFGHLITQAEIISVLMMLVGIAGMIYFSRRTHS